MNSSTLDRIEPAVAKPTANQRSPIWDRVKQQLDHLSLGTANVSQAISGAVYDKRMVLPINNWKMHVARSTAQTLTTNAYTTILFDAVVPPDTYDTVNGYDSSTGQYTIKIAGFYTTGAIINVVLPAVVVEQFAYISLFVNGVERRRGHGERYVNAVPSANTISTSLSNSDYYNTGDVLTIRCWSFSGGANPTTPASAKVNYWTLHLISG